MSSTDGPVGRCGGKPHRDPVPEQLDCMVLPFRKMKETRPVHLSETTKGLKCSSAGNCDSISYFHVDASQRLQCQCTELRYLFALHMRYSEGKIALRIYLLKRKEV